MIDTEMPNTPTVKLLFEDDVPGAGTGGGDIGNWSSKGKPNGSAAARNRSKTSGRCSGCSICLFLTIATVMFLAGAILGIYYFMHTYGNCIEATKKNTDSLDIHSTEASLEDEIFEQCGQLFPWKHVRLPESVVPSNYRLKLHPNLETSAIHGTVDIELKIVEETRFIVLHAQDLNLTTFTLRMGSQQVQARHLVCPRLSQWAFEVDEAFQPDSKLRLTLDYEGTIHTDLSGLYVNSHQSKSEDNKTVTISAVTQFEPTHARKMLPCFDEPSFKAVFDISIIRKKRHLARANMQLIRTEAYEDDLVLDQFAPTVVMPTYLLAVAILDGFEKVRRMTKTTLKPIEVNLYAPSDSLAGQSEFGLDTGVRALEYFEDFFDIPFPLQKTDMLALDDFAEGAMENWGLITFRDAMLLYHPNSSTEKAKETVSLVLCHEMAHQWFGNLVTMSWWNDLWLNEGFANFMEYLCVDELFPEWNVIHDFFIENFLQSMLQDGFRSSHAVSTEVIDPAQIGSIFDAISYQKGASIIQMLRGLAGKDAFRTALRKYLKKFEYSNAKGEDLWKIIQEHVTLHTTVSVTDVAETWTTQVGYPLVRVELIDGGSTLLIKDQTRFLFLEEERYANATDQWPIPVQYITDKHRSHKMSWLDPGAQDVKVPLNGPVSWIVANAASLGYYRVLYEATMYKEFAQQLTHDHTKIGPIDRAAILNDAFCFMRSGHLTAEVVMDLITYVEEGEEADRIPWVVILSNLKHIETLIGDTEMLGLFQKFERSLLLKVYERLGWDQPESHVDRMLQTDILALSCRLQLSDCTKQAQVRFHQWSHDKSSVFVDILPFVIEEGVRHGTPADWERVYREYRTAQNPSQRFMLLMALAASEDPALINRFMAMCLNPSIVRPNVLPRALGVLMQNKAAALPAWRFFRMNYDKIEALYGGTTTLLGILVKSMIENFNTQFDLDQVRAFFAARELSASQARVDQAIEMVKLNIQWRRINEKPLQQWLKKWGTKKRLVKF
uniref:Aminopeptidase n=1 Tax=Panagrellus redivivus TaxID=6233 RepID=A0A7E4V7F3_PANRE